VGPDRDEGVLHDRASYRLFWTLLRRAGAGGIGHSGAGTIRGSSALPEAMPALTDPHLAAAMTGPHPRRRRSSPVPLSQRRAVRVLRALLTPVLLAASSGGLAQPPEPAAVGRDRR